MNFLALPNFRLSPHSAIAREFLRHGATDFHRAVRHVWLLPYARTTPRNDYLRVLRQGRGTCSTKHALVAALAHEHGAPVRLVLGIYEMDAANTPGIGDVLARHGLASILEAHCYLVHEGERIDLTRGDDGWGEMRFIHEETIRPEQIGEYKLVVYQRHLWEWALAHDMSPGLAWSIREECIAALSRAAA